MSKSQRAKAKAAEAEQEEPVAAMLSLFPEEDECDDPVAAMLTLSTALRCDLAQMKANGECFALDDGGCDHMVLPLCFLPPEMKDSPQTSGVKVMLAAGHSQGLICQEEVFGQDVKTPL
eukprot:372070-Amphidinium_carterae.1